MNDGGLEGLNTLLMKMSLLVALLMIAEFRNSFIPLPQRNLIAAVRCSEDCEEKRKKTSFSRSQNFDRKNLKVKVLNEEANLKDENEL